MLIKNINILNFFYTIIAVLFFYHGSYGAEGELKDTLLNMNTMPTWTIDLSDKPRSSQEQPATRSWDIEVRGCPLQEPATVLYPFNHMDHLSNNECATTWNSDLDNFAYEIDRIIFSPKSKKVILLAILGGGAGVTVSSPACGYLMSGIADFFGVPVSRVFSNGPFSNALISWIAISTTPVFTTILHEKGEAVGSWIFKEPRFTPKRGKMDSKPHVIKKNRKHRILEALVFCSAAISAGVPTALMHVSEERYPVFFYITAAPFYLTWLTTYFYETSWNLDQFFQKYVYLAKTTRDKKEILQKSIVNFKLAIRDCDELAEDAFQYIEKAKENGFPTNRGEPFVFSWLFLKTIRGHNLDISPGGLQEGAPDFASLLHPGHSQSLDISLGDLQDSPHIAELFAEWLGKLLHSAKSSSVNFLMDRDNLHPSWSKGILEWLNPYVLGLGTAAKFSITQYVLNDALLSLGLEDESAYAASVGMSVFETAFRMLVMTSPQKKFFAGVPEFFSCNHINNCQIVRKIAGLVSGANAALFSLPVVVAGLEVYKDLPLISKIAYLSPVFLNDLSFYNQLFNRNANKFITYILRLRKPNMESQAWIDQVCRRAALSCYADKASAFIEEADGDTVQELYRLLLAGEGT